MRLLLSDPVPLRTARTLGDYREDALLSLAYGDLSAARFAAVRLADDRFHVADHAFEITSAYVADRITEGWDQATGSDGAGHVWTELRLAAAAPPDATVSVAGRGKRNAKTNELLENPADIVEDLLAFCGRLEDWSALRAECSRLGFRAAGRVYGQAGSIRAQLDEILQSFGIIWTQRMARVYPTLEDPSPLLELDRAEISDIIVKASLTDGAVADVLRIAYDRCDATGRMQKHIELSAAPARFGGLVKEVSYPWLRTPANAEAVGRPVLSRLAGERYSVQANSTRTEIRAGAWIRPVANPEWPLDTDADPDIMVLGVEFDPDSDEVKITSAETTIAAPIVTVTAHSVALPDTLGAQLNVAFAHGIATLTITDLDGRPLLGAFVAMDGGAPKKTDATGQVAFATTSGEHQVAIEAPGKQSVVVGVFL